MKPELKPCPFCGGEAAFNSRKTNNKELIKLNGRDIGYGVNCVECGISNLGIILGYKTEEDAANAWNRRAPAEPAPLPSDDDLFELMGRFVGYSGCIHDDTFVDCARALLTKYSSQPAASSEATTFNAADMASQGAQGFRDGLKAAADAIHNLQQQASNE